MEHDYTTIIMGNHSILGMNHEKIRHQVIAAPGRASRASFRYQEQSPVPRSSAGCVQTMTAMRWWSSWRKLLFGTSASLRGLVWSSYCSIFTALQLISWSLDNINVIYRLMWLTSIVDIFPKLLNILWMGRVGHYCGKLFLRSVFFFSGGALSAFIHLLWVKLVRSL